MQPNPRVMNRRLYIEAFGHSGYNRNGGGLWQMKRNTSTWLRDMDRATGSILSRVEESARKYCMTRPFPQNHGRPNRLLKITTCPSRRFTSPSATARKMRMYSTKTGRKKLDSFESGGGISTHSRLQIINRNEDLSRRRYIERPPGRLASQSRTPGGSVRRCWNGR